MSNRTNDVPLRKLEREPLWDRAHSQLREALLTGKFEPGKGLTLRYLADMLGISVTPVRDAVMRLVAEGVLRQGPRNSAIVPQIGAEELRHLIIIRCELEGRAAFEAASRATPLAVQSLEKSLQTMDQSAVDRDYQKYLDAHREFHFGIYNLAAIPPMAAMIENLWLRCGPLLSLVTPSYIRILKRTNYHIDILAAIRNADSNGARQAIVSDIEQAAQYFHSLMDDDGYIRRRRRTIDPPTLPWP
nr:GntR family transcriptional regulator [Halomonas socia]